jgi:predicted SnoaL-like aldol condensation-catalyzing enzyme
MRARIGIVIAALAASMPAIAQLPVTAAPDQQDLLASPDQQLHANKKLVFDFWREVFQTHDMTKAPDYMAPDYRQHNPMVATGRQPFMDFFGRFPKLPVKATIDDLVTILAERDMLVLAFRREMPDPAGADQSYTTTWFDMFRIEGGKIAEHWDFGTKPAAPAPAR